jgi:hypothetical protein
MSDLPAGFYATTPLVTDLAEAAEGNRLVPIPDDWCMLMADIVGSTRHIEQGEYRNIKLIGAASITAVLNALGRPDLPYFYGGDGSQIACPEVYVDDGLKALKALALRARQAFGFQLRAEAYRVGDLAREGYELRLGRMEVAPGVFLAVFGGNGVMELDRRLKLQPPVDPAGAGEPDLTGLECKWKEIPSPKEEVASLLVMAAPQEAHPAAIYHDFLRQLELSLGPMDERHPLRQASLRLETSLAGQTRELLFRHHHLPKFLHPLTRLKLALTAACGEYLRRHPRALFGVDWQQYFQDVIRHGDSEKFNGMLSMVVSCNTSQRRDLEAWLEDQYRQGRLAYGIHTAKAALITCMVFDRDRHHVHFVDGADGGYASASRELKKRLASPNR